MAKTKRRQLAALAAEALRDLNGGQEKIPSGEKSGPSGIASLDEPGVEIRRQKVTFFIPALPIQSTTDIGRKAGTEKEASRKAKRKRNMTEMDPTGEPIPADEAKISKSIVSMGKWKRRRRLTDLIQAVEKDANFTELSNADGRLQAANAEGTEPHFSEELDPSLRSNARQKRPPKSRSRLAVGLRKRVKLQELVEPPRQGSNIKSRAKRKPGSAWRGIGNEVNSSGLAPRDAIAETDILQPSVNGCNGVKAGTPHSHPARRVRRRKIVSDVPLHGKEAKAAGPKPRTRALSRKEALAVQGFQDLLHERIGRPGNPNGSTTAGDTQLARIDSDIGGKAREDHPQAEQQKTETFSGPKVQDSLVHAKPLPLLQPGQNRTWTPRRIFLHRDSRDDLALQTRSETFALGEQGSFQKVAKPEIQKNFDYPNGKCSPPRQAEQIKHYPNGNCTPPRQADLIKQRSQLAIMKKRLDSAGGLQQWLLSKDLGQFIPVFEQRNIDHLSLLQLTMEGLKGMGLLPLGPRRKLIHALDSLTLPSLAKPVADSRPRY